MTTLANEMFKGKGGRFYGSYNPSPLFLTNFNRGYFFNNSEYAIFDLTSPL